MATEVERRPVRTGRGRRIVVAAMVTALLAVAVTLAVDSGDRADPPGATPAPTGSPAQATPTTTADTDAVPVAADLVRRLGGAAETGADELSIDSNGSALLSFPSADVDTACVEQAQLVVTQLSGDGPVDVWVSLETEAALLADGAQLGSYVIARGSPSASAPSAEAGERIT
jgi:hypothetical protein